MIFTTSNAGVLNTEKGRSLTGRYISKVITPLSYDEFCSFHSLERDENSVMEYLEKGGFFVPETNRDEFLGQLFDDIVVREIGLTNGIRDLRAFKRLSLHLLRHVGEMITANQLKNTLGIKTTTTAVDYLNYLEAGFLMYYVPKFSYSLRKQLVNPRKVYVADTGFVSAATFNIAEKRVSYLKTWYFCIYNRNSLNSSIFRKTGIATLSVLEKIRRKWRFRFVQNWNRIIWNKS